jgi:hypothetical protein
VPSFRALLRKNGGDLAKFYKEVESLSKLPKKERHRRLLRNQQAQSTQSGDDSFRIVENSHDTRADFN